jgi:hypothetical protein
MKGDIMTVSQRLAAQKARQVVNRSINRRFQQVTLRDAVVDFKALALAINTDGDWADLEAVYAANFDRRRAVSRQSVVSDMDAHIGALFAGIRLGYRSWQAGYSGRTG